MRNNWQSKGRLQWLTNASKPDKRMGLYRAPPSDFTMAPGKGRWRQGQTVSYESALPCISLTAKGLVSMKQRHLQLDRNRARAPIAKGLARGDILRRMSFARMPRRDVNIYGDNSSLARFMFVRRFLIARGLQTPPYQLIIYEMFVSGDT